MAYSRVIKNQIMKDQHGMAQQNGKKNDAPHSEVPRLVEDAVSRAVQSQLSQLQSHIVEQVLGSLPAAMVSAEVSTSPNPNSHDSSSLVQAVANIHAGSTQKEILRALLDVGSEYCARIGLFVVKAGAATGWQSRGFGNLEDDRVKDFGLDLSAGPAAHAFQYRVPTPGNIAEMGTPFVERVGAPSNEQVLALPLTLKDKVAALVFADGGDSGKLDSDALELLVIATSAWLEVISLRKQAVPKEDGEAAGGVESSAPPVQTVSSYSDPFAGHAPKHVPSTAPAESRPAAEVVEVAAAHAASAT